MHVLLQHLFWVLLALDDNVYTGLRPSIACPHLRCALHVTSYLACCSLAALLVLPQTLLTSRPLLPLLPLPVSLRQTLLTHPRTWTGLRDLSLTERDPICCVPTILCDQALHLCLHWCLLSPYISVSLTSSDLESLSHWLYVSAPQLGVWHIGEAQNIFLNEWMNEWVENDVNFLLWRNTSCTVLNM